MSSASAPQPSSRAVASARSPLAALRRTSSLDRPTIRRLARQDLAQDRAQTEHVGAAVEMGDVAVGLLRRHVRRRAQDRAGLGVGAELPPSRCCGGADHRLVLRHLMRPAGAFLVGDAPLGQHLGQPPVHHLHLAERPHHDVGRLQVAVDHPLGVGIGHRLRHLQGDPQQARPIGRRVGALGRGWRPVSGPSPASW